MPRSQLQIWNEAMSEYLGVADIPSTTDASPSGEQFRLHYESIIETLMETHEWSWATDRKTLTAITNDRPNEWAYKYKKPFGMAAIRWVNEPEAARQLKAMNRHPDTPRHTTESHIYSDTADAVIEFTAQVVDTSLFSAMFAEAVKANCAARACMALTENGRLKRDCMQMAELNLERAIAHDEDLIEEIEHEPLPDWMRARLNGTDEGRY